MHCTFKSINGHYLITVIRLEHFSGRFLSIVYNQGFQN